MNITYLKNGNLQMEADIDDKKEIREILILNNRPIDAESMFIEELLPDSFQQVSPESIGALADAPIITDGTNYWGYMDYQINSFLTELLAGNQVIWNKG